MKPVLINNCSESYKADQIAVTGLILNRIPDKFLVGLQEIVFYDSSNDPVIRYIKGKKGKADSKMNVYMKGFSNNKKFSLWHYNFILLSAITDHVVRHLQPVNDDPEIQAAVSGRYNPDWVYMGAYSIFMQPLNLLRDLYGRVSAFRLLVDKYKTKLVNKYPNGS